jgi:hypothetical protein
MAGFAVGTADGGQISFRGKMVPIGEERGVRQFITYQHPGGERRPALRVEITVDDDGVPWCTALALTGEPGARRVRSADAKAAAEQLEAMIDDIVAAAAFVTNNQGDGWVRRVPQTAREARPVVRRARKRQRLKTIDLHKVAEVYKSSPTSARTEAVRSALSSADKPIAPRTATRYIQMAREAGLLAPTTQGRATDG